MKLRRLDYNLCGQICAVIQEVVFLQGGMAGGFDCQLAVNTLAVQLNCLVNYVPVASLESKVLKPQLLLQKFRELSAGNAVGNHRSSRVLLRHQSGCHGNDSVSGNFPASAVHCRRSVHVRVKDQP